MKIKKSYFVTGIVVLSFAILVGCGLFSHYGPYRFCKMGFHHPFHDKEFSERILKQIDKRAKKLGFSDTQQKKYEELRGKLEAQLKESMDDREALMEELQTEINKNEPDVKILAESIKKRVRRVSGFMERNLDLFVEFYENLDKKQKDRIMTTIRKKMERCRI